jgi:hypothetical protein
MRLHRIVAWSVGLGLGFGICLGTAAGSLLTPSPEPTRAEVEARARALGMRHLTDLAGGEVTVVIGDGSSLDQVADLLQAAGVLTDRERFLQVAQEKGLIGRLKPGVYHLRPGMEAAALVASMLVR